MGSAGTYKPQTCASFPQKENCEYDEDTYGCTNMRVRMFQQMLACLIPTQFFHLLPHLDKPSCLGLVA